MPNSNINQNTSLPFNTRRTPFHLIVGIIILEASLAVGYLGLKYIVDYINNSMSLGLSTFAMTAIIFAMVSLFQLIIFTWAILSWVTSQYEIKSNEVVYKSGVLSKRARAYDMSNVQSAYVEQSILGRLFNFGNVVLYSPALKNDLVFADVPNPSQFKDMVDYALRLEIQESQNTYLRRFS